MAGDSHVSAVSVMRRVRRAGELCADEDAAAARPLVDDGVVPDAECEASEFCVESDGTYFKLQSSDGGSVEVKAMVAYAGKLAEGGKVLLAGAVRHGVGVNLFFTSFAKQAHRSRKGGFTGCANVFSPIPVTA